MATSATLYRKLAYDTLNAFEYVGLVTEVPMTVVGRKDLEPTDLKGLVEYAKTNKDTVTVANAGIGAASHLCGMLFMSAIGTYWPAASMIGFQRPISLSSLAFSAAGVASASGDGLVPSSAKRAATF